MIKPCLRTILLLVVAACTFGLILIVTQSDPVSQHIVRITASFRTRVSSQDVAQRLPSVDTVASPEPIPKILHHVFLDGLDKLELAETAVGTQPGQLFPGYNSSWRQSCREVHPSWKYMFWDNSRAENLIQTAYPEFLATFQSYKNNVQKGDALRPILMHAYGGLYLDIDVECFLPTDELLASRDVVLQLENQHPKSLNNAVMASVPGHPFWLKVMQIMQDRGNNANDCFLGFRDLGTVLKTTGPYTIRDAFKEFSNEAGSLKDGWAGAWTVRHSNFYIFPMGQWFEPCKWDDYKCHARIQAAEEVPPGLVGHHINSGAWLKDLRWHNRKLLGAWLLVGSLCISAAILCWRIRRRTKGPAHGFTVSTSSPTQLLA
ncbi:hypothetical protein ABBQ32_007113 [Trebouxia sp. C0010 RCD-2024]